MDDISIGEKDNITAKLANFVYRTAIPFHTLENPAWKEFLNAIRPAYSAFSPSAKSLGGGLLDASYLSLQEVGETLPS